MTRAPWEADHDFDAQDAETAIRGAFPDFEFRAVRYFDEGWDFRMYEVDGSWLFRFAKRRQDIERLMQERTVLDALDGALPVAIPRLEFRADAIVGYRKLEGVPLTDAPCTDRFAASLGRFATALHDFPAQSLEGRALPGEREIATPAELFRARSERMSVLDGDASLRARCVRALDVPLPEPYPGGPTLVHNDLYPEHILVDARGEIRGVIDWADAACADPAGDFAIAMFVGGAAMLQDALDAYGRGMDEGFGRRARFFGRCMAVSLIQHGVEADRAGHVRRGVEALERMGL